MARLFVTQERLDEWVSNDVVDLTDDKMTMEGGAVLKLVPAVYVISVIDDEPDPHELVGRVKTKTQLKAIDAEDYMDSLILGEIGYQIRQGFVGEEIASS